MMNPLIPMLPPEKRRKPVPESEEAYVQMYGHSVDSASPRPSMGLFLGRLLIRMGQKLTKEELPLESSRQNA